MTHHSSEVRSAAVSCVEQLARHRPSQLREAGIDTTLRLITKESGGHGAMMSISSPLVAPGVEGNQEIRDSARQALRYLELAEGSDL